MTKEYMPIFKTEEHYFGLALTMSKPENLVRHPVVSFFVVDDVEFVGAAEVEVDGDEFQTPFKGILANEDFGLIVLKAPGLDGADFDPEKHIVWKPEKGE